TFKKIKFSLGNLLVLYQSVVGMSREGAPRQAVLATTAAAAAIHSNSVPSSLEKEVVGFLQRNKIKILLRWREGCDIIKLYMARLGLVDRCAAELLTGSVYLDWEAFSWHVTTTAHRSFGIFFPIMRPSKVNPPR